jgi:NADH-quinone oxidoreductase subunit L
MPHPEIVTFIRFIPLMPLLGFLVNGIFGNRLPRKLVALIGCGAVLVSSILSFVAFSRLLGMEPENRALLDSVFVWIQSGPGEWNFQADMAFLIDPLSSVMTLVVTGVGFLIHVYSIGYMGHDPRYPRYFAMLNLFTFFMLMLVTANNALLLFLGWEGVGLSSYLLIGFWFERDSAASAGKKAFIVNRIGDFGFILAVMLIFVTFRTVNVYEMVAKAGERPELLAGGTAVFITLLLFLGATGKSAQIPLYIWLPDAMEGPTPVSALIHAATMVTAGVYMVARFNFLYLAAPSVMTVVAVIGVITAIFAASIGTVQNDIKRVLAYSTISQLGYMFLAMGVGAFAAGIFHLMTHAFFKALLFLGAGSVIHAMSDEMDMRNMGGLKSIMPITFWTMLFATLAISGVPGFSGFFSKDEILWESFSSGHGHVLLWLVGVITAGLTAFYMFRLLFMTFYGECRASEEVKHHLHESPMVMTLPLMILAGLSIVGGYIGLPKVLGGAHWFQSFLAPVFGEVSEGAAHAASEAEHGSASAEYILMVVSVAVALVGIYVAYILCVKKKDLPEKMAQRTQRGHKLLLNKYYVDEGYNASIVRPVISFSRALWKHFDDLIIDGGVNGLAWVVTRVSRGVRIIQTGYVQSYALLVLIGTLGVIWYLLGR